MSLFATLKNYFRAASLNAENTLIDPVDQSALAIADSEKYAAKFKGAIAKAMAQNAILEAELKSASEDVVKFERIAQMASDNDNIEDAKQALTFKSAASDKAANLKVQIEASKNLISLERSQLEKVENRIRDAKNTKAILSARLQGAEARTELSKAGDTLTGDTGLSKLDNLKKAVDKAEGEAGAFEELNHTFDIPLTEKYNSNTLNLDTELLRLKNNKKSAV